ncbi:hypothetical protein [Clostridium sp. OS1-26]|uniref:hypothetical protein n=1 Tax=Clostridium sp. OS1-26 TaxID=3070681 RepID=UPI0027E04B0F|nr:hypothetical protein [Clostridium sp. OS1-26]WML33707.1 hypothetical protein RCG18_20540 [Clostridium sp. OS1-26]
MLNSKSLKAVNTYLNCKEDQPNNAINTLQGVVTLFKESINEFGAASPEDAVDIWAKGVKIRNGALQYAVLSKSLKAKMEDSLNNTSWITGASSPWIESYKVTEYKKINYITYKAVINFHLMTAKLDAGYVSAELTIEKSGKHWVISKIK